MNIIKRAKIYDLSRKIVIEMDDYSIDSIDETDFIGKT